MLLCLLFASALAQAQDPISINNTAIPGNPSIPFSGTYCSGSGAATANWPAAYITLANLYLNGNLIKTYQYVIGDPSFASYSLGVVFASTQFANNSTVEIKFEAYDNYGNYNSSTISRSVYNVATIYGRNDFESQSGGAGCPAANSNLSSMKHDCTRMKTSAGWTVTNILNDIVPCTAFYVNTHGGTDPAALADDADETPHWPWQAATSFGDIYALTNPDFPGQVSDPFFNTVAKQIKLAISSSIPPVNVAFLDACFTGTTDDFEQAFLNPWGDESATDRAEVGWTVIASIGFTTTSSSTFWGSLAQGNTVQQARNAVESAWIIYSHQPGFPIGQGFGYFLHCWGDPNTTLQGVYTSGPTIPLGSTRPMWY